jgi:chaperonin GroEL
VDLIQAGIIDPAKVVRTALQEAASAAGLLITTDTAILVEGPKETGGNAGIPPEGRETGDVNQPVA